MWYGLQIAIICYLVYIYSTKISPQTPFGYILLFAVLMAFLATWLLSKLFDLLRWFYRRFRHRPSR